MIRLALFGTGVSNSLSPAIYHGFAAARGVSLEYRVVEVGRGNLSRALKDMDLHGFNVTKPLKEEAIRLADHVSDEARVIGAANTFTVTADGITAYNTDWKGVVEALDVNYPGGLDTVLVLGAGGAGRAAIYALSDRSRKILVASKGGYTAKKAARDLSPVAEVTAVPISEVPRLAVGADLLINATPIGWLTGEPPVNVVPEPPCAVLDMVYRPLITGLLRMAVEKGCVAIDGVWMLAGQAAWNLRIWLGAEASVAELRMHALKELRGRGEL